MTTDAFTYSEGVVIKMLKEASMEQLIHFLVSFKPRHKAYERK